MSYNDTHRELQKGPFWQSQFKFHKHIVAFPSEENDHQGHHFFTKPPPPDKRWGQVSQRKVNSGSEQWLGWAGTKSFLAFKLVLLIQAIFNTEKLFTDIFGISPTSWTKNQYTFYLYHK